MYIKDVCVVFICQPSNIVFIEMPERVKKEGVLNLRGWCNVPYFEAI